MYHIVRGVIAVRVIPQLQRLFETYVTVLSHPGISSRKFSPWTLVTAVGGKCSSGAISVVSFAFVDSLQLTGAYSGSWYVHKYRVSNTHELAIRRPRVLRFPSSSWRGLTVTSRRFCSAKTRPPCPRRLDERGSSRSYSIPAGCDTSTWRRDYNVGNNLANEFSLEFSYLSLRMRIDSLNQTLSAR